MSLRWVLFVLMMGVATVACRKQGCTDPAAINYSENARKDNGSCNYNYGCTDSNAVNFDPLALFSDGSCIFPGKVVFYLAEDVGCDTVTVAIDNQTFGNLSQVFSGVEVPCDLSGAVTFELDPGSYTYFVTSEGDSCVWQGQVQITNRTCTSVGIQAP